MQSILIRRFGGIEVLELAELPDPAPKANEVQIEVCYASVNPKDILLRKGKLKMFSGSRFPKQFGYDVSGVVRKVGASVTSFKEGDQVFGMINAWKAGACATLMTIPENEIASIPEGLGFAEAAAMPLVSQTALQALRDLGKIKPGQAVFIHGASGGLGTVAIQIAKILGAKVSTSSSAKNLDLCKSLGADEALDYQAIEISKLGQKFDIFFDVFGNQQFSKIKNMLTSKGVFITSVPRINSIAQHLLSFFKQKKNYLVVVRSNQKDLKIIGDWMQQGKLKTIISAEYPLAETAKAHQQIESKRTVGKVLIKVK